MTNPDVVVTHAPPKRCDVCSSTLGPAKLLQVRQVLDIPQVRYQVTEHRVLQVQCSCGKTHRGSPPPEASAAAQYGPHALAMSV